MKKPLLHAAGSLVALVCAGLSQQASAQTANADSTSDQGLGEILVTARKVVYHYDLVPAPQKLVRGSRTDVPGSAGDQEFRHWYG